MHIRTKPLAGFTIVELLIVIVVIAILAAISLVAFNGVQTRADNAARASELVQWHKIIQAYYAVNGHYPPALDTIGDYCLGTGFPGGRVCESFNLVHDFTTENNRHTTCAIGFFD